jgi:DNA primase
VIPDSFKQQLLNRLDIVDVVSRYVQIKKAGANYQGLCPFHNEKSPSFSVSPAKQFYHCFGCGAHGNAIGFLMAYASMGYIDAMKELASSVGMQLPEIQPRSPAEAARREREPDLLEVTEAAMQFYREQLKKSPQAIEYLKRRGLTGEIAARFRVGYAPEGWQSLKEAFPNYEDKSLVETGLVIEAEGKRYDRFRERIMFPIFNTRGAVIGFGGRVIGEGEPKYLNSPETPLFEKGREVYGLLHAREGIRHSGCVLVVEGYMDVVALAQYGVDYAVATLGTATTPTHVSKLMRLADEIVFCFDGDAAGRKAAWRALEVSLPETKDTKPIKFLFLPDGEDPDTYIRKHGKEAFEARRKESSTLSEFLLGELRGQFSVATPEGRSAFLAAAKPHLQKIAAPVLKLQILKEAARISGMTQEEVQGQVLEKSQQPRYRNVAPAKPNFRAPSSTEWKLLTRVSVVPALAVEVDTDLLDMGLPESKVLCELAIRGRNGDASSAAMVIDEFTEGEQSELLFQAQAFGLELAESEEQARLFVKHTMVKLQIAAITRLINANQERFRKGLLNREEQYEQIRLIAEVKALEQRIQTDGRAATASAPPTGR